MSHSPHQASWISQHWSYKPLRVSDEESNRDRSESYHVPSGLQSRTSLRMVRFTLALLLFGSIGHLTCEWSAYRRSSTISLSKESPSSMSRFKAGTAPENPDIDWSGFAYCQYVTSPDYLCNSVMIFESLHRLDSRAERLMMYPWHWNTTSESRESRLLRKARDEYKVKLAPIHVQHVEEMVGEDTWADSFTKLLAFNQTQYKRIVILDSDATLLQSMDELFFLPSAPVAMPRAYWLNDTLSSQLVVLEPSEFEFHRIMNAFRHRNKTDFDMEIVNNLYAKDCLVLSHRRYDLLTGEFRSTNHDDYLGSMDGKWDAQKALEEAKFLHFSDWPVPKPWQIRLESARLRVQPACKITGTRKQDCAERDIWNNIYAEYKMRRERICGSEFLPRPLPTTSLAPFHRPTHTSSKEIDGTLTQKTLSPFEPTF